MTISASKLTKCSRQRIDVEAHLVVVIPRSRPTQPSVIEIDPVRRVCLRLAWTLIRHGGDPKVSAHLIIVLAAGAHAKIFDRAPGSEPVVSSVSAPADLRAVCLIVHAPLPESPPPRRIMQRAAILGTCASSTGYGFGASVKVWTPHRWGLRNQAIGVASMKVSAEHINIRHRHSIEVRRMSH